MRSILEQQNMESDCDKDVRIEDEIFLSLNGYKLKLCVCFG